MKRSLIRQFNLLIIGAVIIFIVSAVSFYVFVHRTVIKGLQEELLLSNAKEISYIVEDYVQDEIMILSRFANTQRAKDWLMDIQSEEEYNNMEVALIAYSKLLSVESIFIVDQQEKRYYTSTRVDNQLQMPEFHNVLDEENELDQWYFNTMNLVEDYDINIGKGLDTDKLFLWINIVVIEDNKKIGVIGCSLPLEDIIQLIVSKSVTREYTYVIDEYGAIQISSDQQLIQQNSFKPTLDNGQSIYSIIKDSHVIKEIELFLIDTERLNDIIEVEGSKSESVVIVKMPALNWSVIHIYKGDYLTEINAITIGVMLLILLASIMGGILVVFTRFKLLLPIKNVTEHLKAYEETSKIGDLIIGEDEIGLLSLSIINMETNIKSNQLSLEKKLEKREEEVHKLYKDIATNEKNLKRLLNALPIGVVRFNLDLKIVYCNENALHLFGVKSLDEYKQKILKCNYFPFVSENDKKLLKTMIFKNQVLIDYHIKFQITALRHLDVLLNVYRVEIEGVKYYEGVIKDITKTIKYEKQLIKRANYDNLTGVLSRAAFINRLDEFIRYHFQEKAYSYFITFDFDYFKLINDRFGHLAGDRVLKSVLDTLGSLIGDVGVIGRIGGDEFAAIIWDVHEDYIFGFLDQLRKAVAEQEINYEGKTLRITISIGYTDCRYGDNFKVLYYRSDQALYEAKGLGKNKICKNDNRMEKND